MNRLPHIGADRQFIDDALKSGRGRKTEVSVKNITVDPSIQSRSNGLNMEHIRKLSLIHDAQGWIAPVVVFRDRSIWLLTDGFHRHEMYLRKGIISIPCYLIDGNRIDAIVFAASSNQETLLERSSEDVRKSIYLLLGVDDWFHKSAAQIANHVGTSSVTVIKWRKIYCDEMGIDIPKETFDVNGIPKVTTYGKSRERRFAEFKREVESTRKRFDGGGVATLPAIAERIKPATLKWKWDKKAETNLRDLHEYYKGLSLTDKDSFIAHAMNKITRG